MKVLTFLSHKWMFIWTNKYIKYLEYLELTIKKFKLLNYGRITRH